MQSHWSAAEDTFRIEVRHWLLSNAPAGLPSPETPLGFTRHREWEHLMHRDRWATVAWPREYGGRGATLREWLIFEEEYSAAEAPERISHEGVSDVAPALFEFGTVEQKHALLPRMSSAEDVWCRGMSGSDTGGDTASTTIIAERVEGGWLLKSGRVWTRRGSFRTHMMVVVRTAAASAGTGGLTCLLVPLALPSVDVRPVERPGGAAAFAVVSFTDVFLPDNAVEGGVLLGEAGRGDVVAAATTGSAYGLSFKAPAVYQKTAGRLVDLYRTSFPEGDPYLRDRIVRVCMRADAYRYYALALASAGADGTGDPNGNGRIDRQWLDELELEFHETAFGVLGDAAELESEWSHGWHAALPAAVTAAGSFPVPCPFGTPTRSLAGGS